MAVMRFYALILGSLVISIMLTTNAQTTRKVNILIINDENNVLANESLSYGIKSLTNESVLGAVNILTVNKDDPKRTLKHLCALWNNIYNDSKQQPDFILDTTLYGHSSEVVYTFTKQHGIPTLSAQYGDVGDPFGWERLSFEQKKYLIQVVSPADMLSELVYSVCQMSDGINTVILFDNNFVMKYKHKELMLNLRTRYFILPIKLNSHELDQQIFDLRQDGIVVFILLGTMESTRSALMAGQKYNYTTNFYGWYVLTLDDEFKLDCQCDDLNVVIFKPINHSKNRMHNELRRHLPKPHIVSMYYYDLLKFGALAMRSAIHTNKLPVGQNYSKCGNKNSTAPKTSFDFLSKLKEVSKDPRIPTFASFRWGTVNGDHRVIFNATGYIAHGSEENKTTVATWAANYRGPLHTLNSTVLNKHKPVLSIRIVTIIKAPFIMWNETSQTYEGYCMDMLNEIRKAIPFEYTIYEAPDNKYGDIRPDGVWNGMVKEILDKRADIALGAFTLMMERKAVIDFTIPFYDLVGISIMMKRPDIETPLFKFLYVAHAEVWILVIVVYIMASILIWTFDLLSPYSYYNNQEKYKHHEEKRRFTFKESMWFCITSMTPQGGGEMPKNLSSYAVTACWWIFGFSIVCAYTGNLAAYLTSARLEGSINSIHDLRKQYKVQYAPIMNSTEYRFFERMANIEKMFYEKWKRDHIINGSSLMIGEYPLSDTYTRMMNAMAITGFPKDLDEALLRVRGAAPGNPNIFALIGDAADVKYLTMMNCDLYKVGEEFSQKPYAIGLPKGSPLLEPLNNLILTFLNRRHLESLKYHWWGRSPRRIRCAKYEEEYDSIGVQNIAGVFIVVFVGVGLACSMLTCEYFYYNYYQTEAEIKLERWRKKFEDKTKHWRIHIDAYNE